MNATPQPEVLVTDELIYAVDQLDLALEACNHDRIIATAERLVDAFVAALTRTPATQTDAMERVADELRTLGMAEGWVETVLRTITAIQGEG